MNEKARYALWALSAAMLGYGVVKKQPLAQLSGGVSIAMLGYEYYHHRARTQALEKAKG